MKLHKFYLTLLICGGSLAGQSQELLSREDAVERALEFNYDIKVANNNKEIAVNNASAGNNAYLPTLSVGGGANYSITTVDRGDDEGFVVNANGGVIRMNSNVNLDYVLFDGLGRKYTFERSKLNAVFSELVAREVIEGAIVQLYQAYYEVARLTENETGQTQSLAISRDRLLRAQYGYDYGQNSQLDVLNAMVDVNSDSVNLLTIRQQLDNAKRDLNLLLGRDINTEFSVDTVVTYIGGIELSQLLELAPKKNVRIQQVNNQLKSNEADVMINRSGLMPRLTASAQYSLSRQDFEDNTFFSDFNTFGPTAGLNLSWNIFDGGASRTRIQNARISQSNQEILKEQALQQLYRDINNAFTNYKTALFVLKAQETNLETNRLNFDRSLEQYRVGQITSIEFRQAQNNLLNARLSYNEAKYSAKNAEILLLQLSGDLLNIQL